MNIDITKEMEKNIMLILTDRLKEDNLITEEMLSKIKTKILKS